MMGIPLRSKRLLGTYLFLIGILTGWNGCGNSNSKIQLVQFSVDTTHVATALFYHSYCGYGKIQSRRSTPLITRFSGRVHLNLPEGLHYRRGEVIYALTGKEVELQQQRLQAELQKVGVEAEVAEAVLKRREQLREKQFVSPEEWTRLKSNVRIAQANLQRARHEYYYFQKMIRFPAPFDGMLQELQVNEGDYVRAGQALGQFWETPGMKLVGIFYGNRWQLSRAKQKRVLVQINDTLVVKGSLIYLEPSPDLDTGGRKFWIQLDSTRADLRPGMFVKYRLKYAPYQAAAVPDSSLVMEQGRYFVVISQDGAFTNREVHIGILEGAFRELTEGPPPGTPIVTGNVFELFYRNLNQIMKPKD